MKQIIKLNQELYEVGLKHLIKIDPDLKQIVTTLGTPPLWERTPGFATLVLIILEQQVSLASAKAAYDRLQTAINPITPTAFLSLDDQKLRKIGFSRQKAGYCRGLANIILNNEIDLSSFEEKENDSIRYELLQIKGIGHWTIDIYLLRALLRTDILPIGDLALLIAVQKIKKLPKRPSPEEFGNIGEIWKPWRSIATRLLWHYYLNRTH